MRISDWSSDVCSSDLGSLGEGVDGPEADESAEHDHHEEADDAAPDEPFDGLVRARRRERLAAGVLAHEQTADVVADGAEDGGEEDAGAVVADREHQCGEGPEEAHPQDAEQRDADVHRSEEHTSELQSLMRSSYAVFCLKQKK